MLKSEHLSGSPKAALHFIANQNCTVFPAKLLRARKEIGDGRFATFALNRFDDESGDVAFREFALERRNAIESDARVPLMPEGTKTFSETAAAHPGQRSNAE